MSIKWEANKWRKEKIAPVKCVKETAKQVWIEQDDYRGRKEVLRRAKAGVFFDTWKEAHNFLLTQARDAVHNAKVTLKTREDYLTLIESLTEEPF